MIKHTRTFILSKSHRCNLHSQLNTRLSRSLAKLSNVICCWISFKGIRHRPFNPPPLSLFKAVLSGLVHPGRLSQDRTIPAAAGGAERLAACHELLIALFCNLGGVMQHACSVQIQSVCDKVSWNRRICNLLGTPCSSGFILTTSAVWGLCDITHSNSHTVTCYKTLNLFQPVLCGICRLNTSKSRVRVKISPSPKHGSSEHFGNHVNCTITHPAPWLSTWPCSHSATAVPGKFSPCKAHMTQTLFYFLFEFLTN